MPEISVIITIYNKAAFVEKCLLSFLQQEICAELVEIVVVNDGSTDASFEILQQMQLQFPQIRLINQANEGLSCARNRGVEAAKGEYIWFVDADDFVTPEALSTLLNLLENRPDVVCMQAQVVGNQEKRNVLSTNITSGKALLSTDAFEDCVPFYLYRKLFLKENNLHFYAGIYHEDAEFTPRVLFGAREVIVCPQALYVVYPDPQSMARLPKVKRAYDLVTVAESLKAFCHTHAMSLEVRATFAHRISKALNNALGVICCFNRKEQREFNTFLYLHRKVLSVLSRSLFKYRLEYVLFRLFPKHNVQVYRWMKRI